ncbi:ABC transporter substrate-binding protein [Protofrankia symbiont of Coriaria ruscifolia]|uniref:ABC transporter substrate-binding protein n=1 Tax=Protofrankia symbiont of Coriaria ruscifolia TaxID=1306542 RepID=UPI0013EFB1AB|nr:ABC transporter substrate-binding protein [Protofrankia symbiont of Coriaria ruscifolia]
MGIDLDSTGFTKTDPLADLEDSLVKQNSTVNRPFGTIVLLDNMTPDSSSDSDNLQALKHRIQGAMAAVWRANNQAVAGGTSPNIKLLLANYGSRADSWREAVEAIKQAAQGEHIVAVSGIGQSLDTTKQAVAALSDAGIATVGSVITADDMNTGPDGQHIQNFFRVAPLNTDQAQAALSYITNHDYQKILLIQDDNRTDSYAQTLSSAFTTAYKSQHKAELDYTETYRSPDSKLNGADRDIYMTNQFTKMHSDICAIQPDLIYFAGRSADLRSFMKALSEGGACSLKSLDVMTGDDAADLVGKKIPSSDSLKFRLFYTALAHGDQWNSFPADSDNRRNYDEFAEAFTKTGFPQSDLTDGLAMMSHDAVLTAAAAARQNTQATTDPSTVAAFFLRFRCTNTIPGASGVIAFGPDGNPIDKSMPILQIQPDGSVTQQDLAWPTGKPLDPMTTCG